MKEKNLQYKMVQEFLLYVGGIRGHRAKESYLNCAEGMSLKSWVSSAAFVLNMPFYFLSQIIYLMEVLLKLCCFLLQEQL